MSTYATLQAVYYYYYYYKTNIKDIDELRDCIVEEWDKLDQRIIDNAVRQWQKRLQASVAADGGQFEHKM